MTARQERLLRAAGFHWQPGGEGRRDAARKGSLTLVGGQRGTSRHSRCLPADMFKGLQLNAAISDVVGANSK